MDQTRLDLSLRLLTLEILESTQVAEQPSFDSFEDDELSSALSSNICSMPCKRGEAISEYQVTGLETASDAARKPILLWSSTACIHCEIGHLIDYRPTWEGFN